MKARRGAHTVYRLAYHFVWIPRYRRSILVGSLAARLEELIREICDARDWQVEALSIQPNHVHLFVSCPPRYAPAEVMNIIKSLTARELFAAFRQQLRRTRYRGLADTLVAGVQIVGGLTIVAAGADQLALPVVGCSFEALSLMIAPIEGVGQLVFQWQWRCRLGRAVEPPHRASLVIAVPGDRNQRSLD